MYVIGQKESHIFPNHCSALDVLAATCKQASKVSAQLEGMHDVAVVSLPAPDGRTLELDEKRG